MPDSEVSLGEVHRNVLGLRDDFRSVREELASRPDKDDLKRVENGLLDKLKTERETRELKDQLQDVAISKLEGWGNWATKLGLGAIGAALLAVVGLSGKVPL